FTYDCEILENTLNTDIKTIKEKVKQQLTTDILEFYKRYYKEANCDLFYYKKLYKKIYLTNKDWDKFNLSVLPEEFEFEVTVEIKSDRHGEKI
ncbi:MAG: hypothetical protein IJN49_09105, partial [Clostridia bacterium]|nr:hypothetical protein [Clostridia bacterium]